MCVQKSAPMLSLSMLSTPGSSPSTTPMKSGGGGGGNSVSGCGGGGDGDDARAEAVRFMGQLRHNEDHLAASLKRQLKRDRVFVRDVFASPVDEWTPLHACTLRGARQLVKIALKSGVAADLEMGSPDGLPGRCSPLHLAAHRGDVSLVRLLAQHGASLDKRDSAGRTPLHYAASKNNALAARKLIKYGADVSDLTAEQRVYYKGDIERRPGSLLCIPVRSSFSRDSR